MGDFIRVETMPQIDVEQVLEFTAAEMSSIGETQIERIRERTAVNRGQFDQPLPPLKPRYRRSKERRGGKPSRDLRLTGEMMDAIFVRDAQSGSVTIAIEGALNQKKAAINQAKTPWFGISPDDARIGLDPKIGEIHEQHVAGAFR